jgi:hypothetical protein
VAPATGDRHQGGAAVTTYWGSEMDRCKLRHRVAFQRACPRAILTPWTDAKDR